MNNLLSVPISSVTMLTAERAVTVIHAIFRSECGYAKLSPSALTISNRLTTADGGIDAEVNSPSEHEIPSDCIFRTGLTGFQIKSGTTFKPWTRSAIRSELLNGEGRLSSEVARLLGRHGCYTLLCTGHDLTPEQRNESRQHIGAVFAEAGVEGYEELIDVLGASQIVEFAERYPGPASLISVDPIQEAWVLDEWQRDDHMTNVFEASAEQTELISRIRSGLIGAKKHIRLLGEPGLGKTRIVLESVKDESIAPYVLYIQHGSQFGQTKLFRQLLRAGYDKPLVLVIDELPESELSDIWRHLKPRCGNLKIVSLDHGRDESHDDEIECLVAPKLSDETIKKILSNRVGESRELDRWVAICEGSPRVAQAVAENLRANPGDMLKPPSTVPIWARFLHGYGRRDENLARQIDCVTQHLALFSRFGYEYPVGEEAIYIADLIQKVDSTIGWARFQEIVQSLRARRVLQGSRTLFFVPKALHIYLWKQFWEQYGRGFDFTQTFNAMPESLHAWFMTMFKFAGDTANTHVIDDILRIDGIFSQSSVLTSGTGSRFLSTLAEANPGAVLKLLEATVAKWPDQELLEFKQDRQNLVWALGKIAVWPTFNVRAIQVLTRLAVNENADYSNNATGTLIGLFRIGPEAADTEASPQARLPGLLKLLRSTVDSERRLGVRAAVVALDGRSTGFRIVGPEYQGLKERAKLWIPQTYDEWWQAKFVYFNVLVDETKGWPIFVRTAVCEALLEAVEQQIAMPPCTELAFSVLDVLACDRNMPAEKLNSFFWRWQDHHRGDKYPEIVKRLRVLERRYTRRSLASRFQRYVIDANWMEWDEDLREKRKKPKNRAKILVDALASRITRHPEKLRDVEYLLAPTKNAPALWHFGGQLALGDDERALLPLLTQLTLEKKHHVCLHGYLSAIAAKDSGLFIRTVSSYLTIEESAWLGATIALRSDYDDGLFTQCLDAFEKKWLDASFFMALRFGSALESIPTDRTRQLLNQLQQLGDQDSLFLLIELLDSIPFNDSSPFSSDFVFSAVSRAIPNEECGWGGMRGHYWKKVCSKLMAWDESRALPLLNASLSSMGEIYQLSYDSYVAPLANEIVSVNPHGSWRIVKEHLENALPKWRSDLLSWLKGGLATFNERNGRGPIAELPIHEILVWIEEDPEPRAVLMAHATLRTLDDEDGGRLNRELLHKYGQFDGVGNGISATFHSGSWTGPTSAYLKKRREMFRRWLSADFELEVTQWIESELEYLDRSIEREEIDEERSRFD